MIWSESDEVGAAHVSELLMIGMLRRRRRRRLESSQPVNYANKEIGTAAIPKKNWGSVLQERQSQPFFGHHHYLTFCVNTRKYSIHAGIL